MQFNERRLEKLKRLEEKGVNPFPYAFKRTHSSQELQEKYRSLKH